MGLLRKLFGSGRAKNDQDDSQPGPSSQQASTSAQAAAELTEAAATRPAAQAAESSSSTAQQDVPAQRSVQSTQARPVSRPPGPPPLQPPSIAAARLPALPSSSVSDELYAPSIDRSDPRALPRLKGTKVVFVEDNEELILPSERAPAAIGSGTKVRKLRPRKYQLALYEQAKKHNIIACLDTGAGKTLVAVMLLQWYNDLELERTKTHAARDARHSTFPHQQAAPRRIGIFLVNRVPLVDQQSRVIANNSNLDVARISGSDAHQSGSRTSWNNVRRSHDVVVATAQVVLTALTHGYLRMEDIYLLIFDEAHHASGANPYVGIMRFYEEYIKSPVADVPVPRVFGMTASPVKNLKADEATASERLETVLQSHILTAPVIHRAELALAVNKPIECVVEYEAPTLLDDSNLTKNIRDKAKGHKDLLPVLDRIQYHHRQHGPLFADIVWASAVNELRKQTAAQSALTMINAEWLMEKAAASGSRKGRLTSNTDDARLIDDEVRRTFQLPDRLDVTSAQVTPKILKLLDTLACFTATEEARQNLRGIIFVERRETAYALHEIIRRQKKLSWLKTDWVIGHGDGSDAIGLQQNHSTQEAVLTRFRSGEYNLLIATSVIEEGLDVSPCNLIIRFDLFSNHVGFVQSKGRARHKRSRFIIMAERGREDHFRLIKEVADTDRALREWLTDLPDDRIHDVRFAEAKEDPDAGLVLEVKETGARLHVEQAVKLLADIHSALVGVDHEYGPARYEVEELPEKEGFRCTIKLPQNWGIPDVVSDVRARKKAAKRQAAFRACEALYKAGKLNNFLRPSDAEGRRRRAGMPALAPTRLEEGIKVKTQQLQSIRGLKLGHDEESGVWELHATLLSFEDVPQTALNGPCRPLILLTVDPLARSGAFKMRFTSIDHVYSGFGPSQPLKLDDKTVEACRRYTMRLLRWIGRKGQWFCEDENMPYLVIPATMRAAQAPSFNFDKHADLEEVHRLAEWTTKKVLESGLDVSIGQFFDRILLEKEYELGAVAYGVTGVTRYKEEYGRHEHERFERRQQSTRSRVAWNGQIPDVPDEARQMDWFTVSRIERMQNWLTGLIEDKQEPKFYHAVALPPTNVWVHAISASAYRSALMLPSLLERVDQMLGAQRCNVEIFESKIAVAPLIEALTAPTAGFAYNYERLEFIGDTFLKLLATAFVFSEHIESQEGLLHNARREIIMNRTLLQHCIRLKLHDFMYLQSFQGRQWVPPNFINHSGGKATTVKIDGPRFEGYLRAPVALVHTPDVQQKALADLVESTMGAGLISGGLDGALHAARCLGITPRPMTSLSEAAALYHEKTAEDVKKNRLDSAIDPQRLAELEKFLDYKFRSPHIALQAITHQSLFGSGILASYERLEFLGDAVLDYFAVSDVYYRYPDLDQGELTEYKDKLCMNRTLGALAEAVGMHQFLHAASSALLGTIADANASLRRRREDERRKPKEKRGVYWAEVKIPKQVADIVESLVGAVALDSAFDMKVLQALYDRLFKPFYDEFCRPKEEIDDDVREFERFMEYEGCVQWKYVHDYTYVDDQKVYFTSIQAHDAVWTESGQCRTRRRSQINACRNLMYLFRDPFYVDKFRKVCRCRGTHAPRVQWGAQKRKERGY
ncbi:Dicer-like protein 1 [Tilletia horrida]|nr:Dicer-like protein 1 [Tilletia horrida]